MSCRSSIIRAVVPLVGYSPRAQVSLTVVAPRTAVSFRTLAAMASSAEGKDHFDAIVIGSGQGGTPLATAFAKAGQKTLLIEKTHIGGSK